MTGPTPTPPAVSYPLTSFPGTGTYIVAGGSRISGYPQISPGVYTVTGPPAADYAIYGGNLEPLNWFFGDFRPPIDANVGTGAPQIVVIPPSAYVLQTIDYGTWTRLSVAPTLYVKLQDGSWFDVTNPQPPLLEGGETAIRTLPVTVARTVRAPYRMRIRNPGSEIEEVQGWSIQRISGKEPLRVFMPDGNWLEIMRFQSTREFAHQDDTVVESDDGVEVRIGTVGMSGDGVTASSWGWYMETTIVDSSPGAIAAMQSLPPTFETPLSFFPFMDGPGANFPWATGHAAQEFDGSLTGNAVKLYVTADLNLARWADRAFNPGGHYRAYVRLSLFMGANADFGESGFSSYVDVYRATTPTEPIDVYPNWISSSPQGATVPRLLNIGAGAATSALDHIAFAANIDEDVVRHYDTPLSSLDSEVQLDFYIQTGMPPVPANGVGIIGGKVNTVTAVPRLTVAFVP